MKSVCCVCFRLTYNNVTHKTEDSKGVEIKIPGFGSTQTVEWLDSSHFYDSEYILHTSTISVRTTNTNTIHTTEL